MPHTISDEIRFEPAPSGSGSRMTAALFLPQPRERVFAFFSDVMNLQAIMPPWLHFKVMTPTPIRIEEGTLIDYRLRLFLLPLRWQSLISHWDPPHRFVDEQTRGPYRRWHHEHTFQEVEGGTLCRDVVDYTVPGGMFFDRLFVRRDIRRIFSFRVGKLIERFGTPAPC